LTDTETNELLRRDREEAELEFESAADVFKALKLTCSFKALSVAL